jgi:hypothetical protein
MHATVPHPPVTAPGTRPDPPVPAWSPAQWAEIWAAAEAELAARPLR